MQIILFVSSIQNQWGFTFAEKSLLIFILTGTRKFLYSFLSYTCLLHWYTYVDYSDVSKSLISTTKSDSSDEVEVFLLQYLLPLNNYVG